MKEVQVKSTRMENKNKEGKSENSKYSSTCATLLHKYWSVFPFTQCMRLLIYCLLFLDSKSLLIVVLDTNFSTFYFCVSEPKFPSVWPDIYQILAMQTTLKFLLYTAKKSTFDGQKGWSEVNLLLTQNFLKEQ